MIARSAATLEKILDDDREKRNIRVGDACSLAPMRGRGQTVLPQIVSYLEKATERKGDPDAWQKRAGLVKAMGHLKLGEKELSLVARVAHESGRGTSGTPGGDCRARHHRRPIGRGFVRLAQGTRWQRFSGRCRFSCHYGRLEKIEPPADKESRVLVTQQMREISAKVLRLYNAPNIKIRMDKIVKKFEGVD